MSRGYCCFRSILCWSHFLFPLRTHKILLQSVKEDRAIFVWPCKMVLVSVRHLFYQPVDEKIKTWTLRFPAKENPNMDKALFDWPMCCSMTSKPSIDWFLEYLKHCHILFYTFQGQGCNTKDNLLWEPAKINFKFHRNWENTGKFVMRKTPFSEIWSFWSLFFGLP